MFKRSIKLFLLTCIIGLSSLINVNADTLYDKISPGDVIIGNTVFRGNTWISANRAAEAGSLYTLNTGEVNKNTYLYDDLEDWYKYNNDTEKYELLSSLEVSEIQDIIHIYYENNKPLVNTYESHVEYEYDEEYGEEYISDANDVYWFYNEMYGEIFLENENDENVKLDYENETITCPYHYVFDFQVVANDEPINYKGICGIEDFSFVLEEDYNLEEISIESIELTSNSDYPSLLNQDKVEFKDDGYIEILEELEVISYEGDNNGYYPLAFEGKYIAFDIHFSENNNVHYYSFMERFVSNEANYYTEFIDDTTIRLFLPVESYGYSSSSFLLIDNTFGKYEELYFSIAGLERPTYDLTIENIEKVDANIVSNNSLIHSIDSDSQIVDEEEYNYLIINTIGELTSIECGDTTGKCVAIDLILNDEVNYDFIEVHLNEMNSYEIIDNKIRLYLRSNGFVDIVDKITNSSLRFDVILNNFDEEKYISYDNGFDGEYYITGTTELGEYSIEKANNNYNMNLLYDAENSKLYYKNTINTLFMDNDSLKMITTQINNDVEEVIVKDVDLFVYFTDGTETYYWAPSNISETTLYELVSNEISNSEKELKAVIQTFFKPGRVLTETEQAEIDKFDELVETGKVEIVDISSSIYE